LAVGGGQAGYDTDHVGDKDVEKDGGGQGKEPTPFFAGNVDHEVLNAADDDFEKVLHLRWNQLKALGCNGAADDQNEHHEP
jgi:hypothetical protein